MSRPSAGGVCGEHPIARTRQPSGETRQVGEGHFRRPVDQRNAENTPIFVTGVDAVVARGIGGPAGRPQERNAGQFASPRNRPPEQHRQFSTHQHEGVAIRGHKRVGRFKRNSL